MKCIFAISFLCMSVSFCLRRARWCVLLLVFSIAAMAHAQVSEPAEASQAFEQALQALQAQEWSQAELYLERSLMLDPEHADARLQLALLLARRGQSDAAKALIESLINDARTPEAYRQRLRTLRSNLTPLVPAASEQQGQAQTRADITVGYTRNPYARADLGQLTLTLPQGDVTLPLAKHVQAAASTGLSLRRIVPNQWGMEVNLQRWGGTEQHSAGSLLVFGNAVLSGGSLQWSAMALRSIDNTTRQAVGIALPRQAWRFSASLFVEPELERRGYSLRLDRTLIATASVQTVAYVEIERSVTGNASQARTGFLAEWLVAPNWMLATQATIHHDWQGYSPWLAGNAPRSMLAASLSLERHWEVAPGWRMTGQAHLAQRWSNISLFEYRDAGLQVSLQRQWN